MQKGLPIDRKYGIVEWYGIILVLYSDKGVLSGTLFYEQLAADVREAGENPAQFRYRVGECPCRCHWNLMIPGRRMEYSEPKPGYRSAVLE